MPGAKDELRKEAFEMFRHGSKLKDIAELSHSFYYLEDTWIASMYDIGVEHPDGSKDIWTGL